MFDVIVAGGGPAGLSGALMLARCRRKVLVCDLGQPRNRRSRALHGFLTRDGIAPTELNELGRQEVLRYGVDVRATGITTARLIGNGLRASLADGSDEEARFLLIATGVIDDLPAIPGLIDCYGRSVFHCPYCDGWEWRDRRLAVLGSGSSAVALALALTTWSADVVVCTNGGRLGPAGREPIARSHITSRSERLAHVEHQDGELHAIAFESGGPLPRDAIFFLSNQHPQSDLAVRLGCALTARGTVRTGSRCETNVPRVFVVGDASRDAQFAVVAAAEGIKAAVAINKAILREDLGA
jgi:thioredoxin reductase